MLLPRVCLQFTVGSSNVRRRVRSTLCTPQEPSCVVGLCRRRRDTAQVGPECCQGADLASWACVSCFVDADPLRQGRLSGVVILSVAKSHPCVSSWVSGHGAPLKRESLGADSPSGHYMQEFKCCSHFKLSCQDKRLACDNEDFVKLTTQTLRAG